MMTVMMMRIKMRMMSPEEEHGAPNVEEASKHHALKPTKLDHLQKEESGVTGCQRGVFYFDLFYAIVVN